MRAHHGIIYRSRWHLLVTLLVIIAPFLFLLVFSRVADIASGSLFTNVGISFFRLLLAYLIAALLGWTLAVLFSQGRRSLIALPAFDILQSFPTFALLPMAVLAFGPSSLTIVVFLVVTIIWPIIFSVVSSVKQIKHDWREAVTVFGLSGMAYLRFFLLPVSIPGLITGSIIGLGEGWEALIATEIIVRAPRGLGSFFAAFATSPAITLFGILGFLILIFSINKLVWLPLLAWSHRQVEE